MSKLLDLQAEIIMDLSRQRSKLQTEAERLNPNEMNYVSKLSDLRADIYGIDNRVDVIMDRMERTEQRTINPINEIEVDHDAIRADKKIRKK